MSTTQDINNDYSFRRVGGKKAVILPGEDADAVANNYRDIGNGLERYDGSDWVAVGNGQFVKKDGDEISGVIHPDTDGTLNLGKADKQFRRIYTTSVSFNGIAVGSDHVEAWNAALANQVYYPYKLDSHSEDVPTVGTTETPLRETIVPAELIIEDEQRVEATYQVEGAATIRAYFGGHILASFTTALADKVHQVIVRVTRTSEDTARAETCLWSIEGSDNVVTDLTGVDFMLDKSLLLTGQAVAGSAILKTARVDFKP